MPEVNNGHVEAGAGGETERGEGAARREGEAHDRASPREHASLAAGAGPARCRPRWACRQVARGSNREQLYELAKQRNIKGRSKMGKWDLIEALRRSS